MQINFINILYQLHCVPFGTTKLNRHRTVQQRSAKSILDLSEPVILLWISEGVLGSTTGDRE